MTLLGKRDNSDDGQNTAINNSVQNDSATNQIDINQGSPTDDLPF